MTTEQFNRLPKNKQRVLVAKDVIAQLKLKKFKPVKGRYFSIKDSELEREVDAGKTTQLNERFKTIKQCEVCARGAMFMSTVTLGNAFAINQMYTPWGASGTAHVAEGKLGERLGTVFPSDQQYLIETAFEGRDINDQLKDVMVWKVSGVSKLDIHGDAYKLVLAKAKSFYKSFKNNNNRMIAIMKNVIKNKGKFILQ